MGQQSFLSITPNNALLKFTQLERWAKRSRIALKAVAVESSSYPAALEGMLTNSSDFPLIFYVKQLIAIATYRERRSNRRE
jgi:hypothetical protein